MDMARESAARDSALYVSEGDRIILWSSSPIHTLAWMATIYYAKEVIRESDTYSGMDGRNILCKGSHPGVRSYSGMDCHNMLCKGSHPGVRYILWYGWLQHTMQRKSSATCFGKGVIRNILWQGSLIMAIAREPAARDSTSYVSKVYRNILCQGRLLHILARESTARDFASYSCKGVHYILW